MNYYTCKTCGYNGKDSEFFDMICPACCSNIETDKKVENTIPTVFHPINIFTAARGGSTKSNSLNGPDTVIWTTKNGRQIPIEKMTTQHIRNTLNMLKDNGYIGVETGRFYLTCTPPTAEGALDTFDQEFARIIDAEPLGYIDLFEEELKKRGEKI